MYICMHVYLYLYMPISYHSLGVEVSMLANNVELYS